MRELRNISYKKLEFDWGHTSAIVAKMHNIHSKQKITAESINPYKSRKKSDGGKPTIDDVAAGFGVN